MWPTATKQLFVLANLFLSVQNGLQIEVSSTQKRLWIQPIVCKRFLNGQLHKSYEDLGSSRGKIFSYFRLSIESFDKLLVWCEYV